MLVLGRARNEYCTRSHEGVLIHDGRRGSRGSLGGASLAGGDGRKGTVAGHHRDDSDDGHHQHWTDGNGGSGVGAEKKCSSG